MQRAEVVKGKEPASQTVLSFFADTRLDELEMHRARAASTLVGMRLRDILREQLGGTYGVSVNYGNTIPQTGYGTMTVVVRQRARPGGRAAEGRARRGDAAAHRGAVGRRRAEGAGDGAARAGDLARQNPYWIGSLQTVHMLGWDAASIARRGERTASLSVPVLHDAIKKYFPPTATWW